MNFPMMKHLCIQRVTRGLHVLLGASVLALVAACGGGGGGSSPPPASSRFELTSVGGVAGIRDNSSGVVWAAQVAAGAASPGLVPTAQELLFLADAGSAAISANFPFLVGREVKSIESLRGANTEPWFVNFITDKLGGLRNDLPLPEAVHWRVLQRPVGGPAVLVNEGGGLVRQGVELMWRLCSEGSTFTANGTCTNTPIAMTLAQAKALSGSYGGYTGWRLPTKQELQTLLGLQNTMGNLLPAPFSAAEAATLANVDMLEYWTSSATPTSTGLNPVVWGVDFSLGNDPGGIDPIPVPAAGPQPVALVRLVRNLR